MELEPIEEHIGRLVKASRRILICTIAIFVLVLLNAVLIIGHNLGYW